MPGLGVSHIGLYCSTLWWVQDPKLEVDLVGKLCTIVRARGELDKATASISILMGQGWVRLGCVKIQYAWACTRTRWDVGQARLGHNTWPHM